VILGVTPTHTGFRRCRIAPTPFDLRFAEGTVLTPAGEMKVQWQREGGKLSLQLRVPDRTVVDLPDGTSLRAGSHEITLDLTRDNAPAASP
jgi:alpha-L-rhamnosidase